MCFYVLVKSSILVIMNIEHHCDVTLQSFLKISHMTSKKWRKWEENWERKPLKKRWIIPHFYDVTLLIFETLCKVTQTNLLIVRYRPSVSPFKLCIFFLIASILKLLNLKPWNKKHNNIVNLISIISLRSSL